MKSPLVAVAAATCALVAGSAFALQRGPSLFESAASRGLSGVPAVQVAFADLDADGWPDVVADKTKVFMNRAGSDGTRAFVRAAEDLGDPKTARPFDHVEFGDVDNDGRLDAFFGRSTDLSNDKFKDDGLRCEVWLRGRQHVEKAGVERAETTISSCFVDYDRDGVLDLLVGNAYVAYGKSFEAFPTRLLRGRGDGTFEDVTEKAGMLGVAEVGRADSRRPCYGVTHTDWNDDGWQDLLICTYGRQANRLWKNNGDGTFTDVAVATHFDGDDDRSGKYPEKARRAIGNRPDEQPWRSHGNTFDAAVADYDGDGHMDVFLAGITHWWAGSSSDLSMLLVNEGPKKGFAFQRRPELIERKHAVENWNQGDLHAGWLDVDNDGLIDLVIASSDYPDDQILRLYHQREDHTFEEWTERLGFKWLNASHISFADFDGDGATDILVGTSNVRLTAEQVKAHSLDLGLFRNTCASATGNTFLSLRLAGAGKGKANRDAVGARVTLWIRDKRQTREVQGGLGCGGHRDDTDCRFGVGTAKTVDRIEVRWPDAAQSVQTFTNVPTGKLYLLEQGKELREGRAPKVWR